MQKAGESGKKNTLQHYLNTGFHEIQGWLHQPAVDATLALGQLLKTFDIAGPVGEIGVWQGRYLNLISFLTESNEPVIGIDPLVHCPDREKQRSILLENVDNFMYIPDNFIFIEKDSKVLSPKEILEYTSAPFKFFSIDGDHTLEGCLEDLITAESILTPGGIIAVDDIANLGCPGVIEAVFRNSFEKNSQLAPFLIAGNKLFMTQIAFHPVYRTKILELAKSSNFGPSSKPIYNYHLQMEALDIPVQFLGYDLLYHP